MRYLAYIVIADEVTEAEREESLRLFSHRPAGQGEATRWLQPWWRGAKTKQPDIVELSVCEALFQKLVEAMPIEARLAWLAPAPLILAPYPPVTTPTFGFG